MPVSLLIQESQNQSPALRLKNALTTSVFVMLPSVSNSLSKPRNELLRRWVTLRNWGEIVGCVRVLLAAMRASKSKLALGP